jgi:hypothetical protein
MTSPLPAAGWYPDPAGGTARRYWNGSHWTDHFAADDAAPAPTEHSASAIGADAHSPIQSAVHSAGVVLGRELARSILGTGGSDKSSTPDPSPRPPHPATSPSPIDPIAAAVDRSLWPWLMGFVNDEVAWAQPITNYVVVGGTLRVTMQVDPADATGQQTARDAAAGLVHFLQIGGPGPSLDVRVVETYDASGTVVGRATID